jgi:hypothetical protein
MTYYTITLILIFLLGVLIFKFGEYLKNNFSLNNEILKSLEKLNRTNERQEINTSNASNSLSTIVNCINEPDKKSKN